MSTTWSELGEKLIAQAKPLGVPLIGQFELTPRCNLNCRMCYICRPANDENALSTEYTAKDWIELARSARDSGMLYLLLTGGEVFLRKDFRQIYEEVSLMGFNIEIYTNATLINPETARWLGQIPPSKVGVTLYGASPETYYAVTGSASAYEHAVQGIDHLLSENIAVELKTTVIRKNINDYKMLSDFALKRGRGLNTVSYISPRHQNGDTQPESERLSPEELVAFERSIGCYLGPESDNIICRHGDIDSTDNLIKPSCASFDCSAGKCAFWVSWDGRMTPCGLMDSPATLPFKDGFFTSWSQLKQLYTSLDTITECSECALKEYCSTCPAVLENESGAMSEKTAYLCKIAQLRWNTKKFNNI